MPTAIRSVAWIRGSCLLLHHSCRLLSCAPQFENADDSSTSPYGGATRIQTLVIPAAVSEQRHKHGTAATGSNCTAVTRLEHVPISGVLHAHVLRCSGTSTQTALGGQ